MHCVKLNLICSRIAIGLISRKFQTCTALSARKHKMIYHEEPGLQHLKSTFEGDEELMKDLSEENDDLLLDHQYLKNDIGNDKREERWNKELLGRKIAKKKYFKTKPQPAMLTWAEKEYIKYLHKTDPVQWNISFLSESFPATPAMIKNILKTKLKLSPSKIEQKDKKVQENWKLLSEDKLEGDPEFIEHCKQFVNSRNVILDNAKKLNFYLPEIKERKTFNCGEMSSILEDYEKMLDKMIKSKQNLLTDGKIANSKNENQKGNLELLHQEIEEERKIRDLEGKESFFLNKYSKNFKRQVTFQELQKGIFEKVERGRTLNLSEKAILERELNKNSYNNTTTLADGKSEVLGMANEELGRKKENLRKRFTSKLGIYEPEEDLKNIHAFDKPSPKDFRSRHAFDEPSPKDFRSRLAFDEPSPKDFKSRHAFDEPSPKDFKSRHAFDEPSPKDFKSRHAFDEPSPKKDLKNWDTFDDSVPEGKGSTKILDATNVGKFVHYKDNSVFYNEYNECAEEKTKVKKKKQKKLKASTQSDITVEERSNVDCSDGVREDALNEEKSIFLGLTESIEQNLNEDKEANLSQDNHEKNEDRIILHLEDKNSIKYPQPKESPEVKNNIDVEVSKKMSSIDQTGVMFENYYPERIVIPEDKRKLGSLFKVKDCYYDNQGEFLYRVPGITK